MCGIVGFAGFNSPELIKKLNHSQIHRGPDDEGYYTSPDQNVTLAMRRLSIQDLAGGHQPLSDSAEKTWIVFNGEIFNAPELRKTLESVGRSFKTKNSDTEVVLQHYLQSGKDMLARLNGMYAFVIYDQEKGKLFGARDRFGIKPFNFVHKENKFVFASEIKSLLEIPWIKRDVNSQSLYHYLSFQCVPSPQSIFNDIQKLPAGCLFEFDLKTSKMTIERYWKPNFITQNLSFNDAKALVREELTKAVKRWTLSDVPIACSLSGGIDSTAVVGLMSQMTGTHNLKTFSLGFNDEPEIDETKLARLVANKFNTTHHEILINSDSLLDSFDEMIFALDEPYAGGLPSWFVYKEMAKEVHVAMTGTGGDEIFGNYSKWLSYESITQKAKVIGSAIKNGANLKDLFKYPHGFMYPLYFRDHYKKSELLLESFSHLKTSEGLIEDYWRESELSDARNAIPYIDFKLQLPEEFLYMTDRFSMAHSIEARTPFLDHEFAEKMFSIGTSIRTNMQNPKQLLIEAVRDLLPQELLNQPKKGFVLPVSKWLRGRLRPHVETFLGEAYLNQQNIFDPKIYTDLVKPHMDLKTNDPGRIWTLLMFQFWYERFIKNRKIEVLS